MSKTKLVREFGIDEAFDIGEVGGDSFRWRQSWQKRLFPQFCRQQVILPVRDGTIRWRWSARCCLSG
ncbi:MAG: hypothetical protein ABII09_12625 [Planctomycetota bacterium]